MRGWLKAIDDLASPQSGFGAKYTYYADGNVRIGEFHQPGSAHLVKQYHYAFGYDGLDRLTGADYMDDGVGGAFDVSGLRYDRSGNITDLRRRDESGVFVDDLTYSYDDPSYGGGLGYEGETNRLQGVSDAAGVQFDWDAGAGGFAYDAMGRMTEAPAPYEITKATYDERSLPTTLTSGGNTFRYRYSLGGERYWAWSGPIGEVGRVSASQSG